MMIRNSNDDYNFKSTCFHFETDLQCLDLLQCTSTYWFVKEYG